MRSYPYIPKPYYPAVMFACKMLREGTGRNTAIYRASKYYHVDAEEVSKYVAQRSSVGRWGHPDAKPKYTVIFRCLNDDCSEREYVAVTIERAHKEASTNGAHFTYKNFVKKEDAEKRRNLLQDNWRWMMTAGRTV